MKIIKEADYLTCSTCGAVIGDITSKDVKLDMSFHKFIECPICSSRIYFLQS